MSFDVLGASAKFGAVLDPEDLAPGDDARRLSAEGLRLILDTIPGLVTVHSADGALELVNHRVLDYFGRTFEELKDWATSDAVHPDDRPETVAAWNRSMETGTPFVFEHRLRRRDGTHRWFQSRGHPLRDAEGRVMRWYSLFTDVDDLKTRANEAAPGRGRVAADRRLQSRRDHRLQCGRPPALRQSILARI